MSLRLSGSNQLSYIGVTPLQPPDLVYMTRDPISGTGPNADYRQFNVGTFWLNHINDTLWVLVRKQNNNPFWLLLALSPIALITHFTVDTGAIINPVALNVNIFGGTNINTSGVTPTVLINLNPIITVTTVNTTNLNVSGPAVFGGSINTNLARGVVQSPGGGGALFSDEGTDGQVLISSSTGAPAWNNLTSGDGSVTITNGPNTIDLTVTGGGGGTLSTLTGNVGVATPVLNNINIVTARASVLFVGAGDTLTLDFLDAVNANLALGASLLSLTTGQFNTGIGALSLFGLMGGNNNTALGAISGTTITNGNNNTLIGANAGANIATGSDNIAIGESAGINYTNENNNIVIDHTGVVADSGVIRIGTFGVQTSVFLQGITGIVPNEALVTVDTTTGQLGISSASGPLSTLTGNTGPAATPLGGNINIKTDNSTVVFDGTPVLHQLTQDFGLTNLLLGSSGSMIGTATNNAGYGLNALNLLTNGTDNVGVGSSSLSGVTNGNRNTAVGFNTLSSISTQNDNTALGSSSLASSLGGSNTALGSGVLSNVVSGTDNIAIGQGSGISYTGAESANILVGNSGVLGESVTTRIGTAGIQTRAFMAGIRGVIPPNGPLLMVTIGTDGQLGSQAIPSGGGGVVIETIFNTPGPDTWTMNPATKYVLVIGWGGGGGGGSGRRGASGSASGGGAGVGGAWFWVYGPSTSFGASEPVFVGSGGVGGSPVLFDNTDGNVGTDGIPSSLGSFTTATTSNGGSGGNSFGVGNPGDWPGTGGTTGVWGANFGSTINAITYIPSPPLPGRGTTGNGTNARDYTIIANESLIGSGGGGGGGANSVTERAGGRGGNQLQSDIATIAILGGSGGTESGTINGGNGNPQLTSGGFYFGGTGGGGGGGQHLGLVAGDGGDGGQPGSGGGGGGGSLNGTASGAGGTGADGMILVVEWT